MFSSFWFHLAVVLSLLLVRYVLPVRLRPRLAAARTRSANERLAGARETCDSVALTLFVLFFLIQPFVAQAYYIPTGSMANTLPIGTRILASPLAPRVVPLKAGEVVVFYPPTQALELSGQEAGDAWIKRCIGTPGQTIEVKKNVLWRDGKVVAEPYAIWSSPPLMPITYDLKIVDDAVYSREYDSVGRPLSWTQAGIIVADQSAVSRATPAAVPSGKYLMLGDHRNHSLDGHVWGFINRDAVIGRAFVSFWPPQHIGTIER